MVNTDIPEEYADGFTIFLGCRIDLSKRPLIPRPETEIWVEQAIRELKESKAGELRILDIFSGSGCIGVVVAKNFPDAHVDFSDIDGKSIEQIKINIIGNGIFGKNTQVFKSDIFKSIPTGEQYDAILANPPYIDPKRIGEVQKSVLDYEPHNALFATKGGLDIIDKFLKEAFDFLKVEGIIYLEFDPSQREDIDGMIRKAGYRGADFFKDQFGEWRFVRVFK